MTQPEDNDNFHMVWESPTIWQIIGKMMPSKLILAISAILLIIITVFAAFPWIKGAIWPDSTQIQPEIAAPDNITVPVTDLDTNSEQGSEDILFFEQVSTKGVMVAIEEIEPGDYISNDEIAQRIWPAENVPAETLDNETEVVGRYATHHLVPGQLIMGDSVSKGPSWVSRYNWPNNYEFGVKNVRAVPVCASVGGPRLFIKMEDEHGDPLNDAPINIELLPAATEKMNVSVEDSISLQGQLEAGQIEFPMFKESHVLQLVDASSQFAGPLRAGYTENLPCGGVGDEPSAIHYEVTFQRRESRTVVVAVETIKSGEMIKAESIEQQPWYTDNIPFTIRSSHFVGDEDVFVGQFATHHIASRQVITPNMATTTLPITPATLSDTYKFRVKSLRAFIPCDSLGRHHIFIKVEDVNGEGINDLPIKIAWSPGDGHLIKPTETQTNLRGQLEAGRLDFAMFKGSYTVQIEGEASEIAGPLAVDGYLINNYCSLMNYEVVFQEVRK